MADQVKQLAFKKFTTTELQNGTAANVLTTDASTHYVIKSIEATQGNNSRAVTATATLGLTAGLAAGEFTSLGTVAKANRVGLSGSAIMDASSTLTIRPNPVTIAFADELLQYSQQNSSSYSKFRIINSPQINGVTESALVSRTTVDKTSVSFSHNISMTNYPNNHVVYYTNANGVNLKVMFTNGGSSSAGFEVNNADTGASYGYYQTSYCMAHWDGGRYIFMWHQNNGAQVLWFDLDETETNLASANTYGGSVGQGYYHGIINLSGQGYTNFSSYDNRRSAFFFDKDTGQRFITQFMAGNTQYVLAELPSGTLTNYTSTTNAVKWIGLGGGSWSSGTDPFGNNNGNAWNSAFWISNYNSNQNVQHRMTYDTDKQHYVLHFIESTSGAVFTFTKEEYNSTPQGSVLEQGGQTSGYGLFMVGTASASNMGFNSNWFTNYSSGNGRINYSNIPSYSTVSALYNDSNRWFDGDNNLISGDGNSPNHVYKINLNTGATTKLTTGLTDAEANQNYNRASWFGYALPSSSTIASRTYLTVPSLKIRVTGILSDQ